MNKINTPSNDNEAFNYIIEFSGFGQEAVVGTVDQTFVDYWSAQEGGALTKYVCAEEDERPLVPSFAEVPGPWHEADNMAHVNGPYSNGMKIVVSNGFDQEDRFGLSPFCGLPTLPRASNGNLRLKKYRPVTNMMVVGNFQHHILRYSLALDRPFEPSKMLITEDEIDGLRFLDKVIYNDNELDWQDWYVEGRKYNAKIVTKKAR